MSDLIQRFIVFSENLNSTQLNLIIICAFLLLLYLAYRVLGLGAVLGLLLIGFFVYILYDHDSFKKYEEKEKNEAAHMRLIEKELQKNSLIDD